MSGLEDFFWFIENIKTARGLDFTIDEEKFSDDDCIVEWLAELSAQLLPASLAAKPAYSPPLTLYGELAIPDIYPCQTTSFLI